KTKRHDVSPGNGNRDGLVDAELMYRAMFEQSPYGILIIDTNGRPVDFNGEAHRQLGYTREEFAKLRISDIDPCETPQDIEESMKRVLTDGLAEFDVKHRTKGGDIRDVHVITQVLNLSGRTVFQTIWQDITERRRVEMELDAYREHLEDLVAERTAELSLTNERLEQDITERKRVEADRERLIAELQKALSEIRTLKGLIPVCAWCRKIRDDDGHWLTFERYIEKHSDAKFTHGICPHCIDDVETRKAAGRR
ncbi:MAG: PAS domain S-box protein, partial [Chloroflexota bacterium]